MDTVETSVPDTVGEIFTMDHCPYCDNLKRDLKAREEKDGRKYEHLFLWSPVEQEGVIDRLKKYGVTGLPILTYVKDGVPTAISCPSIDLLVELAQ